MVQRCLDVVQGDARQKLLGRICSGAIELMQDAFGNYVVQYVTLLTDCGVWTAFPVTIPLPEDRSWLKGGLIILHVGGTGTCWIKEVG